MKKYTSGRILISVSIVLVSLVLILGAGRMLFAKNSPKHITILYTDDTLGTLEPCGCHGNNSGGLPRRAGYIRKVLAEDPKAIVLESGNLAFAANYAEPTAQLEAVTQSIKAMGYTAIGVGPTDVSQFGDKYYEVARKIGMPIVQTDGEEHPGAQPYIIKDIDGVKVGIVSFGAVAVPKKDSFALAKARFSTLAQVRQMCDVLVLLDQGKVATNEWLEHSAPRLGTPDIVIGGYSQLELTQPQSVGKTMVVPTSTQGVNVGRIDIEIDGDGKKLTFSRQHIDPTVPEDAEVLKIVRDYTKAQNIASSSKVITHDPFYSYQSCESCHPDETEQWKGTRHAGALKTLITGRKTIPDCLPCHSEMYRRQNRIIISIDQSGGIECMTCHANVLPHGVGYKAKGDTETIKQQCAKCHTKEKSPDFDIQVAYEKIRHKTNK